ncbi:tigger transposable element-derived protein 6-like [Schistocerca piceifrons]|uniref:tigger transposable element-derived protein 6-like n=1 Tax=Schistocerca piceifrons TaxID=274613 RepID=UPI001F5FAE18|nr:tigger transposable element-derived protein 6-like [Schistocerca piceifrons]
MKTAAADDVDSGTLQWLNEMRVQNVPINALLICQKALDFASCLAILILSDFRRQKVRTFRVMQNFRGKIPYVNCQKNTVLKTCQLKPEKTMAFRGETCKEGKQSKVRQTVLLCSNASGTHKLTPLVIGRLISKPTVLQKCKKLTSFSHNVLLQLYCKCDFFYKADKKEWMTSNLFCVWLLSLDREMAMKNKKIALLVDNCSVHKKMPALKNVELCYFPSNLTSILQPLDMGIIKNCKTKYRSCLNSVQLNVTVNCWKNARISESEDFGENVVVDERMQHDIQSVLEIYSAVTGKTVDATVVEYLSVHGEA